ncbi:unnamed protein product, partial [marine sediment metagenome]
ERFFGLILQTDNWYYTVRGFAIGNIDIALKLGINANPINKKIIPITRIFFIFHSQS